MSKRVVGRRIVMTLKNDGYEIGDRGEITKLDDDDDPHAPFFWFIVFDDGREDWFMRADFRALSPLELLAECAG